jgi:hypothetical protein
MGGFSLLSHSPPAPENQHFPTTHAVRRCFPLQVANFLNPVNGIRDLQRRVGIEPRDHARDNRRAIRDASQKNYYKKLVTSLLLLGAPASPMRLAMLRAAALSCLGAARVMPSPARPRFKFNGGSPRVAELWRRRRRRRGG